MEVAVSWKVQRSASFIYPSQETEEKEDGIKKYQNQIKTKPTNQKTNKTDALGICL